MQRKGSKDGFPNVFQRIAKSVLGDYDSKNKIQK